MGKPLLIWGAGAIGGTIGAHLIRAGQKVLLVDTAEDHVTRMKSDGLVIEGPLGGFKVAADAVTPDQLTGTFDAVLLAVKSQHTEAAVRALHPHLANDGYVASCQNGINEPRIAAIVGRERTIGAFVNFAGDYLGPGRITFGLRGTFAIGELDGSMTPRVEALRANLAHFEPDVVVSSNIYGFLWGKTSYAAVLTASALTNDTIADFIADPARRHLNKHLVLEVLDIAVAEGVKPLGFDTFVTDAFIARDNAAINASLDALAEFNRGTGKTHSGIWRDLAVRKRKTEIGAQLVPIREAADRHGIELPLLNLLGELIATVEDGKREQSKALADELSALAAEIYR
jgi:2-dehydropantoate 2-reductase